MSGKTRRIAAAVLVLWLLAVTCNMPSNVNAPQPLTLSDEDIANTAVAKYIDEQGNAAPAETAAPAVVSEAPPAPPSATSTQCQPTITATTNVNVRNGPGSVYDIIGALPTGATAPLAGRSDSGNWWYIAFPGGADGYGWVSASYATASCAPQALAVIVAPPTPTSPPPTKTEKPNFLVPMTVFINPHLFLGDIRLVEIFQSTHKEVILRVAVNPTNSLSGTVTYKVWLDGSLKVTTTVSLPAGSIAYWSGVFVPNGNHTVRGKVDTSNKYSESDENNNDITVTCNGADLSCN